MLKKSVPLVSIVALCLALVLPAGAAVPRTYQVTGPVLSLTDDLIVVQKGNDKWEIARDASVKVTGELKVGATVTIEYRMSATSVEVKPAAKAAPKAAPKK